MTEEIKTCGLFQREEMKDGQEKRKARYSGAFGSVINVLHFLLFAAFCTGGRGKAGLL